MFRGCSEGVKRVFRGVLGVLGVYMVYIWCIYGVYMVYKRVYIGVNMVIQVYTRVNTGYIT